MREAFLKANDVAGHDQIQIAAALAGLTTDAAAGSPLPTLIAADNDHQPPAAHSASTAPATVIGNECLNLADGADNSFISGLALTNCSEGIDLKQADGVQIQSMHVGFILTAGVLSPGDIGAGGGFDGIELNNSDNVVIGDLLSGGNTISNTSDTAIRVQEFGGGDSTGVQILGNTIGDVQDQSLDVGNDTGIVLDGGNGHLVAGNTIGGNGDEGVGVFGATGTVIRSNLIGINASNDTVAPNSDGIQVGAGAVATIGGPTAADGNHIAGNDSNGVELTSAAGGSVLQNNVIGLDSVGNTTGGGGVSLANANAGILVSSSPANQIGTPGAGNVVSNNAQEGILVTGATSTGNRVEANTIGLKSSGAPAGNGIDGIRVESGATSNIIGSPGAGNLVGANADTGIEVNGSTSDGNVVQGNSVGVNSDGNPRGNGQDGISINAADNATVGGLGAGEGNVSSANTFTGIDVENGSDDTTVRGNVVGTNAAGTLGFPNELGLRVEGLRVLVEGNSFAGNTDQGAHLDVGGDIRFEGNLVGKSFAGSVIPNGGPGLEVSMNDAPATVGGPGAAANTITGNLGPGVLVSDDGSVTTIAENSIFANGGLGIDLEPPGVTPNDAGDVDAGPDGLQNFPELSSAQFANGQTTVTGSVATTPSTDLTLRFYASSACDPSGNGEGQRFLGATTVTTDGGGNASFTAPVGGSSTGEQVTATATSPDGTSEFSACRAAEPAPPPPPEPEVCQGKEATIVGTDGKDKLRGTSKKDVISGLGGNDTISGLGGNDIVCGDEGNDVLTGGGGRDKLNGGKGRDRLNGGSGKGDLCEGGAGKDQAAKSCEQQRSA